MNEITFITFFYDIGREKWKLHPRSVNEYLISFLFFKHFNYKMIVFIDDHYYNKLISYYGNLTSNITFIPINIEWLNENIWAWSRYEKEKELMNSDYYKSLIPERINQHYPENTIPEYTILTHSKIDFVNYVIDNNLTNDQHLAFVDFGYFHNKMDERFIPKDVIDINKLDLDKINLCAIKCVEQKDKDVIYTLKNAPEKIGAYFFFGNKDNFKKFQELCHKWLIKYQEEYKICDDEQALWLQCYFDNPGLFKIWSFGWWHQALKYFSK